MSLTPGQPVDVALPIAHADPQALKNHGVWWLDIVGRLRTGVTVERARARCPPLRKDSVGWRGSKRYR